MKNNTQNTLLITHGNEVTLKLLSRKLNSDDSHWYILFDAGKGYQLKNRDKKEVSLTFQSYKQAIDHILKDTKNPIRTIAIDANFGAIGGENFSTIADAVIRFSHTKEVLFFSDTASCIDEAKLYMRGQLNLKPPFSLKLAYAGLREELRTLKSIEFVSLKHGCLARTSYNMSLFCRQLQPIYQRSCLSIQPNSVVSPARVYLEHDTESGSSKTNTTVTTKIPRSRSSSV